MYKNLDGDCFGISGRQNEVVEYALSNGFEGITTDFSDLVHRTTASGLEFAARYLVSAKMLRVGVGKLNLRLAGTDEEFEADLATLDTVGELIEAIRGVEEATDNRVQRMCITIQPYSQTLAYHENFEKQRERITRIAEKLAEKDVKLGLGIQAAANKREGKEYEFIHDAEGILTLVKAVGMDNVGLDLNTWDWQVGKGAMDQLSDLDISKIVSVTLADAPENGDLENLKNSDRLSPGEGDSAFTKKVCAWLHENNYDGPVTPGPSSSNFSGSSRDPFIHRASNNIDEILVSIGAIEPVVPEVEETPVAPAEDAEASESESGEEAVVEQTS